MDAEENSNGYIGAMYRRRFLGMGAFRRDMWAVLCRDWFQQFIPAGSTVLEVGAGHCEFINAIEALQKIAVDINPDTAEQAAGDVKTVLADSTAMVAVDSGSVDVVFMSNFLEHLGREAIADTLAECRRILKPGGRILVLQPNVRYLYRDYWMFFDHVTPIDDRALCEILEVVGFSVSRCIPRFLPYTTQSRLPKSLFLVRLYLKLPLLWRFLGGQAFVVAEKRE
jgi:SAM-dependent methyltransferase